MARVLLVDDDLDFCDAAVEVLAANGHAVDVAASAQAALSRIELEPYDALLLDLEIPDMPGAELLRRLRGDPRLTGLRVVVCTAWPVTTDLKRELSEADAVVQKTGAFDELLRLLDGARSGSAAFTGSDPGY